MTLLAEETEKKDVESIGESERKEWGF